MKQEYSKRVRFFYTYTNLLDFKQIIQKAHSIININKTMKKHILFIAIGLTGLSLTANAQSCCGSKSNKKSCDHAKTTTPEKSTSIEEMETVSYTNTDSTLTDSFTVYGNCGMCKRTIEGSLKDAKGVQLANWETATDQLTISYDSSLITLDQIKQKIADVGYDSDTHRAESEVYNALPGCCQYERPLK
jgi:copper chaperone CopZ